MFRKCLVQNCIVRKKGWKRYFFEVRFDAVTLAEVMLLAPWFDGKCKCVS